MAGPSTREAGPRESAPAGLSGSVTAVSSIAVLLAFGLALRLIIAYVLLPGSGFPNDLASFRGWGSDIALNGPLGFYDRASFIDYPPVYLILLGAVGFVTRPLGGMGDAVKLIPILADLGLAYVVWQMAQELGASRRKALAAATIVLLNPITWINSAIWGQADVVGTILLLLGLRALMRDRREAAAALAVLATLTKIQLGILAFLVAFVVLRRSLAPRDGERREPLRVFSSLGAGLVAAAIVCLPFGGIRGFNGPFADYTALLPVALGLAGIVGIGGLVWWLVERYGNPDSAPLIGAFAGVTGGVAFALVRLDPILSHMASSFGEYPYLTVNAYNPWALVTAAGRAMMRNRAWIPDSPPVDPGQAGEPWFAVGPFPPTVATVLVLAVIGLAAAAALAWLAGRSDAAEWRAAEEPAAIEPAAIEPAPEATVPDATVPTARGWRQEVRPFGVACLAVAAVLAFVLVLQIPGAPPAALIGDGLLIAIIVAVCAWAAWRDDRTALAVALAILAIAFFVVPTRAHERYLFPFFGVGAVLLAISWRWRVAYVALAVANTINLLGVLVEYNGIPDTRSTDAATQALAADQLIPGLARMLNDWGNFILYSEWPKGIIWPIALASVITGLGFLWALAQMRPRAAMALEAESALAAAPVPGLTRLRGALGPMLGSGGAMRGPGRPDVSQGLALAAAGAGPSSEDGSAGRAAAGGFAGDTFDDLTTGDLDDYEEEPALVPPRAMEWWRTIARRSVRPDRSPALRDEPHGRLDKLDLWVVVALVITVLTMRTFRLGEPTGMYFDEVYHARTGMEFLQDWRYGIPHYIYEYTHPHFAKYAIAGGITVLSDDKVTASSDLGVPVKDAVVQPRRLGTDANGLTIESSRLGDRLYVATGTAVNAYDLRTRAIVQRYPIAGATALSLASDGSLFVGTSDGEVYRIDTDSLDTARSDAAKTPAPAQRLAATAGFGIARIYAAGNPVLIAADVKGNVVSIDASTGQLVSRGQIPGLADVVTLNTTIPGYGFVPDRLTDVQAEARLLASAAGTNETALVTALGAKGSPGAELPLTLPSLSSKASSAVSGLITAGKLPGIVVADSPEVYIAYQGGVGVLDARHLVIKSTLRTDAPATSISLNPDQKQDSYVASGKSLVLIRIATSAGQAGTVSYQGKMQMPGTVTRTYFNTANNIVQALGRTPDGAGWTSYAVDTNGETVFSDARLPFEPAAWGFDVTPDQPNTDREALLAFAPDGRIASVDVGQFAFSWRFIGVLFGALMAACLYLLARVLFRRRTVGLLVAAFAVLDGMLFVQSRIAMNDTYVGGFLLLGYLLFGLLWTGVWRNRWAFWLVMPVIGVVLGLALASKWVAVYAIASIGMLILVRSALGRLVIILAMAGGTGVLGHLALVETPQSVPGSGNVPMVLLLLAAALAVMAYGGSIVMRLRTTPDRVLVGAGTALLTFVLLAGSWAFAPQGSRNGGPNYTFFLLMLGATIVAAAVNAYHPIAWTREETWFAVVVPIAAGALASIAGGLIGSTTFILVGLGGVVLGIAAGGAFYVAGRWGFGPLAPPPTDDDPSRLAGPPAPAPTGWLRLGSGRGLPAVWMAGCLLALPIAVYVVSYVPWAMPWQPQTKAATDAYGGNLPVLYCAHANSDGNCPNGDGWPAGHTGKTLMQLTNDMYTYHNDLRATHAASSPWWAWPMDLKPVWFQSDPYAGRETSNIYDGGNVVLWWLAIPGLAFACWQAFKRRSLGLTLIAVAFFWQWLSWSRIDRASFQYHFYTALPFFLVTLAYFLAELWHGPSRRTWLLARIGVAAAVVAAPLAWLLRYPLCGLGRVDITPPADGSFNFPATACGPTGGSLVVETRIALILLVLVLAFAVLAVVLVRLERRQLDVETESSYGWLAQLVVPVVAAGLLLLAVGRFGPSGELFRVYIPAELPAIVLTPLLVLVALGALTIRDPRRMVLGVLAAAVVAFMVLYPNLSAMPMSDTIAPMYNGFLPTWLYGFQFGVNMQDSAAGIKVLGGEAALLTILVLAVAVIAAYAAWVRRVVVGYRRQRVAVGGSRATLDAPEGLP